MPALVVIGEDPVNLDGSIDSANNLQIKHGSDSLASYDQTLHAKHNNLRSPSGIRLQPWRCDVADERLAHERRQHRVLVEGQ
jgi:hypothetical protein